MTFRSRLAQLGFKNYLAYLQSPHWESVQERYSHSRLPQSCLVCGELRYQLRHRTYCRLGRECLGDLVPLCGSHYFEIHECLKKQNRRLEDIFVLIGQMAKLDEFDLGQMVKLFDEQSPRRKKSNDTFSRSQAICFEHGVELTAGSEGWHFRGRGSQEVLGVYKRGRRQGWLRATDGTKTIVDGAAFDMVNRACEQWAIYQVLGGQKKNRKGPETVWIMEQGAFPLEVPIVRREIVVRAAARFGKGLLVVGGLKQVEIEDRELISKTKYVERVPLRHRMEIRRLS